MHSTKFKHNKNNRNHKNRNILTNVNNTENTAINTSNNDDKTIIINIAMGVDYLYNHPRNVNV